MKNTKNQSESPPQRKAAVYVLKQVSRACAAVLFAFSSFAFTLAAVADQTLPSKFYRAEGQRFYLPNTAFGISVKPAASVTRASTDGNEESYSLSVMGIIPIKSLKVKQTERRYVIPSGESFGIRLYSDGVMVVGIAEVMANGQKTSPAYIAGLRSGDIITHIDGVEVNENSQVIRLIADSKGNALKITFNRKGKNYSTSLSPALCGSEYKAGLWVRDSVAGIGTLTYIDGERMLFAGLGHGIADSDCGNIYPVDSGSAVRAQITSATKGQSGTPGELRGYFTEDKIGELFINTETGIYGGLSQSPEQAGTALPVAFRQEIKKGKATVLTTVDSGGVTEYEIEIEKINYSDKAKTRNMIIKVTDPALIEKTGGIVQGMSGSPILQDGKLVGAITHVFVNDPTCGYAIFAENMLETAENYLQNAA